MNRARVSFYLQVVAFVAASVLFVDMITVTPVYVLENATIKSVQDNSPLGFIGEKRRTLVQFDDGWTDYIPGTRGRVGDVIRTYRKDGSTMSLFGIFGDTSAYKRTITLPK